VADGIATPAEIEQLATKSAQMVDKFKADMRQIEPDDYSDLDIEIITAMAATSYAAFQRRDEAYAKVLPAPRVMQALEGAPAIGGFSALHRYSSDLSPAQTVSQFGLDYTIVDKATGAVETPFLVKEKGKLVPQPFLFSIAMPMSPAIREGARVPLDPRVFQKMKLLAQDPSRPAGDPLKQMAQTLTKSGVCCISQRNPASPPKTVDEQARQAASDQVTAWCTAHGYRVLGANDAPYTGNSMPQYGSLLDGRGSYADLIQEMHTPITPCPPGAVITLRLPNPSPPADPSLPAGSVDIEIARWSGDGWDFLISPDRLAQASQQALAGMSAAAQKTLKARLLTVGQLRQARDTGRGKLAKVKTNPFDADVRARVAEQDRTPIQRAVAESKAPEHVRDGPTSEARRKRRLRRDLAKKRQQGPREAAPRKR
jgi:hypothetical protein